VITSWNPGAERLYGYLASEAMGQSINFLLPPGASVRNSVLQRIAGGERVSGHDTRVQTKGGSVITIALAASPIVDADGAVVGVSSIAHDTTERRRLEAELRHTQKLESVGQLAAGIAHEINTPIQFVGDNVRFLREAFEGLSRVVASYRRDHDSSDPTVPSEARRLDTETDVDYLTEEIPGAIDQTLEGVEQVATLVRAMKAFGHPSSEDKAPVDINEAIRNTLVVANNELKYIADVVTDLGELPPVWCHLSDINQVLLNLVVNAAHAIQEAVGDSGQRGRITVRTSRDDVDAVIEVTDTGVDIPAEIMDRIFEPFFTTKDVGVGTGQGLAIAHSLIHDRHHGTIGVQSQPGEGTTFRIRLPFADPNRTPSSGRARHLRRSTGGSQTTCGGTCSTPSRSTYEPLHTGRNSRWVRCAPGSPLARVSKSFLHPRDSPTGPRHPDELTAGQAAWAKAGHPAFIPRPTASGAVRGRTDEACDQHLGSRAVRTGPPPHLSGV
jgi:PAS domain S-box-containing protein